MSALALVSCVGQKASHACEARGLYRSPWFRMARRWVEGQGLGWYILSAEYGLLDPNAVRVPYERTLNTLRAEERRAWADGVLDRLLPMARARRVVILAGARYREFLVPPLMEVAASVEVPMAGLGIGQQLSWLKGNTV